MHHRWCTADFLRKVGCPSRPRGFHYRANNNHPPRECGSQTAVRVSSCIPGGTPIEVRCDKCQAVYDLDDQRLAQTVRVRCPACGHLWKVSRRTTLRGVPTPEPPAADVSATPAFE